MVIIFVFSTSNYALWNKKKYIYLKIEWHSNRKNPIWCSNSQFCSSHVTNHYIFNSRHVEVAQSSTKEGNLSIPVTTFPPFIIFCVSLSLSLLPKTVFMVGSRSSSGRQSCHRNNGIWKVSGNNNDNNSDARETLL